MIRYLDDSEHAQLFILDLSSAFDSLNHNILISSLWSIIVKWCCTKLVNFISI